MSEPLDLPQAEALLRRHYARLDPGALRSDATARIRARLEAEAGLTPDLRRRVAVAPVRPMAPRTRLGIGWSMAATVVVALLVVIWLAVGRPATPPVAASPSALLSPGSTAPAIASSPSASGAGSPVPSASGGAVVPSPPAPASDQRATAFADRNHGIVVGEYQGQGAIWTTADAGQTWSSQLVSTPPLDSVAVLGTRAWASATCLGGQSCTPAVLTSSDSGATWSVIGTWPIGSLTFVSADHGFGTAVGSDALTETTDGGKTWSPYPSPCEANYVLAGVSFGDAKRGWAACDSGGAAGSSNKEVLSTQDGGVTWTIRSRIRLDGTRGLGELPATGSLSGIQMLASGTGIAWSWSGGLIRTSDGGVTWAWLPLGQPMGSMQWPGAAIAPDGSLFALTVDLSSGDGSATFNLGFSDGRDWKPYAHFGAQPTPGTTPTPEPTSPPQPTIADSGVAFFDANSGIAIGNGPAHTYLWRTADGGKTWATVVLGAPSARLMATQGDRVWISTSSCPGNQPDTTGCTSTIERSDDRGATWRAISHQALSSVSFGDATHGFGVGPYVTPTPSNTIGGSGTGVYATSDGGATWAAVGDVRPCGSLDPVSVSFVSSTRGWLGCEGSGGAGEASKGVMETTDGGKTWSWTSRVYGPGGSPTNIGTISISDYLDTISMQTDGAGFMTGLRNSTFRTTDGGRTWTACPPGEFDAFVTTQASMVAGGPWFLLQFGGNISPDPGAIVARLMRSEDHGATWTQVGGYLPNP